jgi:hypothetical protein
MTLVHVKVTAAQTCTQKMACKLIEVCVHVYCLKIMLYIGGMHACTSCNIVIHNDKQGMTQGYAMVMAAQPGTQKMAQRIMEVSMHMCNHDKWKCMQVSVRVFVCMQPKILK